MKRTTKLIIAFLMIVGSFIESYGSDSETVKNVGKGLFPVLVAIMVWHAVRKTHNDNS